MKNATVFCCGSWGTALSTVLAERGLEVKLWSRDPEEISDIVRDRENKRFLPGVPIADSIEPTADIELAAQSELLVSVLPSIGVADFAKKLAAASPPEDSVILSCTKGMERDTGRRMTEILGAALPANTIGALSGPNHAEEVGRRLPSAAVIGCTDADAALRMQSAFTLPWFRTYTSDDVAGIELGGAVKNTYAICAGIAEGLGLGDNAKAALVTRGLAEMIRLGVHLGGRPETFQGLSGVGDLIVTCYSSHSRNNSVGKKLGQGGSIDEILGSMSMVAEGVPNTISFHDAALRAGINTPIIDQAYAVLKGECAPAAALSELLSRDPRPEADQ